MHLECGHGIFGNHSKFSMMHCKKCNFVLIDVEVKILLTLCVSMMANKVCLYQKYVSIFLCLHPKSWRFSSIHFSRSPVWSLDSEVFVLHVRFHCFHVAKRTGKTTTNLSIFAQRVNNHLMY